MEKHIHRWPRREEQYLVKLTKDPEIAAVFKEDFVKGCAMIAEEINKHWSRPDNYVPLDAIKVESKLKGCKQVFAKTDKEVFAPLLLVLCPTTARSLFVLFVNLN